MEKGPYQSEPCQRVGADDRVAQVPGGTANSGRVAPRSLSDVPIIKLAFPGGRSLDTDTGRVPSAGDPGSPHGSGRAPASSGAAVSAELVRYLTEDHDRIAQGINDVVIHRIFAAGLDLHAALGLIGDHRGASKIYHAIDELDQAVRDIRDTIFGHNPGEPRPPRQPCPGN